jgi:ribosomal protein S18 acetylase RimI-like enzyme
VETELLGDDRIPPSRESLAELRRAPLSWLGALRDDRLVGAAGWSVEPDVLDIVRPVVSPEVHRRGVDSALVRRVLAIAGDRPTLVSTGRDNRPARALCERLGFTAIGETEVVPGPWVTGYRHPPALPRR